MQTLTGSETVLVSVSMDDGVCGSGEVSFGRIAGAPKALAAIIESELKPIVIGRDLAAIRNIYAEMLRETEYHGSFGLSMFAIAAVDTALWDCLGRSLEAPCWKMWGAVHSHIPAYAMVGRLNYTDAELQDICRRAVEQGFTAVKIKVGYPTLKEDLRRTMAPVSDVTADLLLENKHLTGSLFVDRVYASTSRQRHIVQVNQILCLSRKGRRSFTCDFPVNCRQEWYD